MAGHFYPIPFLNEAVLALAATDISGTRMPASPGPLGSDPTSPHRVAASASPTSLWQRLAGVPCTAEENALVWLPAPPPPARAVHPADGGLSCGMCAMRDPDPNSHRQIPRGVRIQPAGRARLSSAGLNAATLIPQPLNCVRRQSVPLIPAPMAEACGTVSTRACPSTGGRFR